MAGRVLGTTDYVSPEQALGQPVTGQSDIYSLGVVLYEMLTGEVPFTGASPVAVAMRHVRERAARRPAAPARRVGGHRVRARPRGRQGPRRALPRRRGDGRRPRGGARDRDGPRSGQATGEVTSVLRTLPGPARAARCPGACATRRAGSPSLALIAVDRGDRVRARRPRRPPRHRHRARPRPRPGLQPVSLGQTAAHGYNPFGTGPKTTTSSTMSSTATRTRPGAPSSTTTARSRRPAGSARPVPRRSAGRRRQGDGDPDADARLRGAGLRRQPRSSRCPTGTPRRSPQRGWVGPLGPSSDVRGSERITLSVGAQRYRYYLVWITALPPDTESASIGGLTLFR